MVGLVLFWGEVGGENVAGAAVDYEAWGDRGGASFVLHCAQWGIDRQMEVAVDVRLNELCPTFGCWLLS